MRALFPPSRTKGTDTLSPLGSDIGLLHQAIYCLTQAIKGNKEDVDAMWDRAVLLKLSGATNMVGHPYHTTLSNKPAN